MTAPTTDELAPTCRRCGDRHLPGVRCWRGRYAARLVTAVLLEQGRTCWLCGGGGADSVDHEIPRSRGGTDNPTNLRPVHHDVAPYCNRRRGNDDPFTPDPDPQPTGVGLSPRWRTT